MWGTTRTLPALCFVLEVVAPGLLVVKYPHGASGKFVNIVVLEGDQVKVVDEQGASIPDCPEVVSALLGFDSPGVVGGDRQRVRAARRLDARARPRRRAARRAGRFRSLAAVDRAADSVLGRAALPGDRGVDGGTLTAERTRRQWQDELTHAVDAVAGLTAVDGATVMNDRYELLAFAVKIARHEESARVEEVMVTEPVEGMAAVDGPSVAARRHAASVGRAVRLRSARCVGARRLAGRALHDLPVVALRGDGARAPGGGAAAVGRFGIRRSFCITD